MPITGTANYTLIGNTSPTDNFGNVGVLGAASFSADFTNQTVNSTIVLDINNAIWDASGSGLIGGGAGVALPPHLFNGTYNNVTITGLSGTIIGTGVFSGFFSQPGPTGNRYVVVSAIEQMRRQHVTDRQLRQCGSSGCGIVLGGFHQSDREQHHCSRHKQRDLGRERQWTHWRWSRCRFAAAFVQWHLQQRNDYRSIRHHHWYGRIQRLLQPAWSDIRSHFPGRSRIDVLLVGSG